MTTYSLFGQPVPPPGGVATAGAGPQTFAVEFEVSQVQGVYDIWFYSASGLTLLPLGCGVWNLDSSTAVVTTLTPAWSGAAGSGWVSCAFDGTAELDPGTHYAAGYYGGDGTTVWRTHTAAYWTTGAGASGITNGVISAPNNVGAVHGQGCSAGLSFGVPTNSGSGQNFWADVTVGPLVNVAAPGVVALGQIAGSAALSQQVSGSVALEQEVVEE